MDPYNAQREVVFVTKPANHAKIMKSEVSVLGKLFIWIVFK